MAETRKKFSFPNKDELVVATITKVQNYGAFGRLEEYQNCEGMIHISEISNRWIKNIGDFVKDGDRCWFVKLSEIRLFESEGNYARLYFSDFKPLILRTLNSLDDRLDPRTFFRANRKHIVNLKWIDNIEPWLNGGLLVKLKGGQKVEVSRRQSVKFRDMLSL